jgi:hypothetical protein
MQMLRPHRVLATVVAIFLLVTQIFIQTPAANAVDPCPNSNALNGISGLILWLRADCVSGSAADPADNSSVTTWSDQSGLGNNATSSGNPTFQSDSANLINSNPVISFSGFQTFSSIDIRPVTRPNLTVFAVYKARGSGSREGVWGIDNGSWDRFLIVRWSGNNGIVSSGGFADVAGTGVIGTPTLTTTVLKHGVSNDSKVYVNGALTTSFTDGSDPNNAYTNLLIGSGGAGLNFTGEIAEIIIFSQALSVSNLQTVNGYLNPKYNLNISSSNLPVVDTTPPTFTSTNAFTVAENTTSSTTAATVKSSESATITISPGADASLFNIVYVDSITASIRFKAPPDFEAPIDSGGNNVYNFTLTATDPAGNAGTQAITITVSDLTDTSSITAITLSGSASYGKAETITVAVSVPARVTFRVQNFRIPGCISKLTTGVSPNITATCSWKPSIRGSTSITATAIPTGAGISSVTATLTNVLIGNRSTRR